MNAKKIGYWTTTGLVVFFMLSGAAGEITQQWGTLETSTILGYPLYFLTIIGIWKVLGSVALLVPRYPRLKEWAYAGIFFNMTGAALSHVFCGDYGPYAFHVVATLAIALLAVASWALRPPSRRLGDSGTQGPYTIMSWLLPHPPEHPDPAATSSWATCPRSVGINSASC